MDADALKGRKLGTNTLQRVIGAGTMGAVYLAHQSPPSRQVAVKVFLRATSLELQQQIDFLETFQREIAPVALLDHPYIVSIYDYDDVDGLAYIVMPYVAGETLEEALAHEGALPLATVANYLEQIAAGLDYAHGQGIVHRDLKPSNILLTPEKRVLLADFQLTKMLIEGKTAQMRLSKPGLLDYMAPELVLGKELDQRADLYSLGAILYRMVTGTPPFQGQTLMKVATKHLKMLPPSPRILRPDLPAAAEQIILRALAKNPEERYASAQDLHLLFRQSINTIAAPQLTTPPNAPLPLQDITVQDITSEQHDVASEPIFAPRMLFGPKWRTDVMIAVSAGQNDGTTDGMSLKGEDRVSSASLTSIASTDAFSAFNDQARPTAGARESESPKSAVLMNPMTPSDQAAPMPEAAASGNSTRPLIEHDTLAPNSRQEDTGITGTYKLTGPARIVTIPVAGQPGQFITGILPASPSRPLLPDVQPAPTPAKHLLLRRLKVPTFVLAALLIVLGSLTFWYIHSSSNHSNVSPTATTASGTPDAAASATARAKETLDANIILFDPLKQNIRGWPVSDSGPVLYQFKGEAYHITNNDPAKVAPAILPGEVLNQPFVYWLTMDEVRGNDTSLNNQFGMIIRFNSQNKNGKQVVSFYSLEVLNNKGGEYQFWKYDNSQGAPVSSWTELAHHAFGAEFKQGQGPNNGNTFKILVNGKNFALIVNGKQVWSVQDGSFTSGQVGMLVNLKGTEVAFSNLRLTFS